MEAGQLSKNVIFIIQARMGSSRLPGKILLPIPLYNGKPLIKWITDEIQKSTHNGKVVVATSIDSDNDVLERFCIENQITCFRGDESDVLSRFIAITETEMPDHIVRLTGDNPVIDISIIDSTVDVHISDGNDYTGTTGLPIGVNVEVVSAATLLSLKHQEVSEMDREHVTLYIKRTPGYRKKLVTYSFDNLPENLRLTIDYPSDFLVVSHVLALNSKDHANGMKLVNKVFEMYPWIFDVNKDNVQKTAF